MASTEMRLYPLGKDYVIPIKQRLGGIIHGVWNEGPWITCCGLDVKGSNFDQETGPLSCTGCLARLREQGWDV